MVNYLAVAAVAVLNMVLGMVWYHPKVFGAMWMNAMGLKEKDIDKKGMGAKYASNAIASFVFAIILALLINLTGTTSALEGAIMGATVWLGFVATSNLPAVTFEGKPLRVYLIFVAYQLVVYLIGGAIIASWG
jgi:Na+/proline symporter